MSATHGNARAALGEPLRSNAASAPRPLLAIMAMAGLAGLDLVGALLAKQWSDHRSLVSLAGGFAVFSVLFLVYGSSLEHADLATVTFGWIVLPQIGVVVLQWVQQGTPIGIDRGAAMVVMHAIQAYLVLAPPEA